MAGPSHARSGSEALSPEIQRPTIAVIIDDMGNQREPGLQAINLPAPLTLAFLPGRRYTTEHALLAHQHGKEVMLHAPMENQRNLALGAMGLTRSMSAQALITTLRDAIRSIPYVSGVNNHMGSLLTEDRRSMQVLMAEIRQYPLYFVDSRTSARSVAYQEAKRQQIPSLARDVFLDHIISYRNIHTQFRRLIRIARQQGTAIAIGHPHKETLRYLERALPRLAEEGINVATVKGIWAIRHGGEQLFRKHTPTRTPLVANRHTESPEAAADL